MIKFGIPLYKLENFVVEAVGHRAPSHSDAHMRLVFNNATKIYEHTYGTEMLNDPLYLLIATVAWLHDVADHKFIKHEPDLKFKVTNFLNTFTEEFHFLVKDSKYEEIFTTNKIESIIDRISFSKEKKYGDNDWLELLGEIGVTVRNIVSDADKLEAIGKAGIQRCAMYAQEKFEHENIEATKEMILNHVVTHYDDKLKHLSTKYMRTEYGKELAKPLDEEMLLEFENMKNNM